VDDNQAAKGLQEEEKPPVVGLLYRSLLMMKLIVRKEQSGIDICKVCCKSLAVEDGIQEHWQAVRTLPLRC